MSSSPLPGACAGIVVALLLSPLGITARAQTDYYNTDAGRPLIVEDALPVERHALELQLAPLSVERASGGHYRWSVAPELAWGALPRTQLEIAFPVVWSDLPAGTARRGGLAGVELGLLHNLNAESRTLPAFALAAEAHLPVGALAGSESYYTLKGIATRTFTAARLHINAAYTAGDAPSPGSGAAAHSDQARWRSGVSVDRAFPLRSLLIAAEIVAEQPLHDDDAMAWTAGTGLRWQWSPRVAVDAGVHRRFTGDDRAWSLTFGAAYAFGWRPLIPGLGR